jgi:hypothetical protein
LAYAETVEVLTGLYSSYDIADTTSVGVYSFTVLGVLENANYTVASIEDGTWIVDLRPLVIDAIDDSICAGDIPIFSFIINENGLVNGDTLSGALSVEDYLEIGTHTITQGTLTASGNYEIFFTEAILEVVDCDISVSDVTTSGLKVYPNPVSVGQKLYIDTPPEMLDGAAIEVYNMLGILIEKLTPTPALQLSIPIDSKYSEGAYMVVLKGKHGVQRVYGIVVD